MARGVHVTPSGKMTVVEIDQREGADVLAQLQKQVGGLIESVPLDNGAVMYVNEEGLIRGYFPNRWASNYANQRSEFGKYYLVGEVFIIGDYDEDDEDELYTDAPADLITYVQENFLPDGMPM